MRRNSALPTGAPSVVHMCFSDPETGERWCERDVEPPGEFAHIHERRMAYAKAYEAQHGALQFPDWLSDEFVDLLDTWRQEYRAWYAAEQAVDARRAAMQVARPTPTPTDDA